MTSKLTKLAAAGALSLSAVTAVPAQAEMVIELLDLLKAKGAISQAEYDKLKARHEAESKGSTDKVRAAEAKAREAEAKARTVEAKVREEKLRAADMPTGPLTTKAPPVQYVTVLPTASESGSAASTSARRATSASSPWSNFPTNAPLSQ